MYSINVSKITCVGVNDNIGHLTTNLIIGKFFTYLCHKGVWHNVKHLNELQNDISISKWIMLRWKHDIILISSTKQGRIIYS